MTINRTRYRLAIPGIAWIIFSMLVQSSASAADALLLTGFTTDSQADSNASAENDTSSGLNKALSHLGIPPDSAQSIKANSSVSEYFKGPGANKQPAQSFAFLYTSCMMSMATESGMTSIRLSADPDPILIEAWDSMSREAFTARLERRPGAETDTELQESSQLLFNLVPNGSKESLLGQAVAGFDLQTTLAADQPRTEEADTSSKDESSGTSNAEPAVADETETQVLVMTQPELGAIAPSVNIQTSHSAWIAEDVDGKEIYRQFFKDFVSQVAPGEEENLLYRGLLQRQLSMLKKGLPLRFSDTTVSIVGDKKMHTRTLESWASSIQLIQVDEERCASSSIPDGYQVTKMTF